MMLTFGDSFQNSHIQWILMMKSLSVIITDNLFKDQLKLATVKPSTTATTTTTCLLIKLKNSPNIMS